MRHRQPANFAPWSTYQIELDTLSSTMHLNNDDNGKLSSLSANLFSSQVNVRLIDVERATEGLRCISRLCTQVSQVEALLAEPHNPRMRIISIHSRKSILPLNITQDLMRKILSYYQVESNFLDVLYSFGDEPHLAEGGSSNVVTMTTANGSRNTYYQFRYAEENHRKKETPWSVRQTGAYHHHSTSSDFDLWILLHPVENSVFENQLIALSAPNQSARSTLASLDRNPFHLHLMLCSSYSSNWRWYLRYLGDRFQKKNDDGLSLDLMTAAAVSLSFDSVQVLRHLHDTVISLSAFCKADLDVIKVLEQIPEAAFDDMESFDPCSTRFQGYLTSLDVLQNRIRNAIDLLAYALDVKNQNTAAEINEHLLSLTRDTVDDSAIVKIITVVSLLYLPGSFVATLYGMNLFVFDSNTMRLEIAENFWIYVATWIPLTLLTMALYGIIILFHKKRPMQLWHWPRFGKLREA